MDENEGLQERDPRVHEIALKSQDFLNTISEKAHELQLAPNLVISLFGLYMKRIVETAVASGTPEEKVVTDIFAMIGQSLGINMQIDDSEVGGSKH
jgi:hypothetical protein